MTESLQLAEEESRVSDDIQVKVSFLGEAFEEHLPLLGVHPRHLSLLLRQLIDRNRGV